MKKCQGYLIYSKIVTTLSAAFWSAAISAALALRLGKWSKSLMDSRMIRHEDHEEASYALAIIRHEGHEET